MRRDLIIVGLLQSSSEIFRGVFAKFLLEIARAGEFSNVGASEGCFERLMSRQRIQEREETCSVRGGEKTYDPLGFIIKGFDVIGRGRGNSDQLREWNQVLRRDRRGMRFGDVTAGTLVTGVRSFRDVLRQSFVQPAWNPVGVES